MENKERPTLSIIQDIKSGSISVKALDKETRIPYVEILLSEGCSVPQIAQALDRSEKTIRRDIVQIRENFFKSMDKDFAKRTIGNLLMKAEAHSSFLMRLARSREGSVGERVQAEYLAWKTTDELARLLQNMGVLPLKPKEVVGDFFHHHDDENKEKSFVETREELSRVIKISKESGTLTPELEQRVASLNRKIEKAEIVYATNKLIQQVTENKEGKDE